MAEKRVQRRLAAILAADVVGYSRMMREDETGTLAQLKVLRKEVFDPRIAEHQGRIVKTAGDGLLVEFASAVDATECAIQVQRALARRNEDVPEGHRIELRIGINLGDIIVDGDDIFGDGVNVAARLEGLCDTGEVYVSAAVHDQVEGKIEVAFEDLGEHTVKNIDKPIGVFRVSPQAKSAGLVNVEAELDKTFERPAVAVLPFQNMSGDPEQEYFADGLTLDIITALSLWRSFPVIARNSTFAYKGTSPDVRKVGQELGARFVVEGSVRKVGDRVRVTAQLINAETGHHVWAERYDRQLEDIFELQDEITHHIAAIIEPTIARSEQQRIVRKSTSDLAAWEYCLRGYAHIYGQSKEGTEKAREMFYRAIELDEYYARAYSGLAWTYANDLRFFEPADREDWSRRLFESARRAVSLDGTDAEARTQLVRAYQNAREPDSAIAEAKRAVELNPHNAMANMILGAALSMGGARYEEGIPWCERALLLNPTDPRLQVYLMHLAIANLGAEHYEKAVEYAQDAIRREPSFAEARIVLAASLGYLGRIEEARTAIDDFKDESVEFVQANRWYAQDFKNRLLEGLRKAELID